MGFKDVNATVDKRYAKSISHFGDEFSILQQLPIDEIQQYDNKLSAAIQKLRQDEKYSIAGYDEVHGRIYFFEKPEFHTKHTQMALF